jgi:hypothetical protein
MSDQLVNLATFYDPIEARLAKNYLEGAGIPVLLSCETTALWGMPGIVTVQLQVTQDNLERAAMLLESVKNEESVPEEDDSTEIMEQKRMRSPVAETAIQLPPSRPVHAEDWTQAEAPANPEEEAEDRLDRSIALTADALAARAFRASIWGLCVLPFFLHLYSVYLLLQLSHLPDELSPKGKRQARIAMAINGIVLSFAAFVVLLFAG